MLNNWLVDLSFSGAEAPDALGDIPVDLLRPASTEWVFNSDFESTHTVDLHGQAVSVLYRAKTLMVGPTRDQIPGVERGNPRRPSYELGNRVIHILGAVILSQFVVHPQAHVQVLRIGDFVPGDDPRSHRTKRVPRLMDVSDATT